MEDNQEDNQMSVKDAIISMMSDLPYESNRKLMLEEMRLMAEGMTDQIKFKDVSSAVDAIIADGGMAGDFGEVLKVFVEKMESSERDKLLILILSQIGVSERFAEYSGIRELYHKTKAKAKCIRYALNLVSKHYDQSTDQRFPVFVVNLFGLVFEGKPAAHQATSELIENLDLIGKGLEIGATKYEAEKTMKLLISVMSPEELKSNIERVLANKPLDMEKLLNWVRSNSGPQFEEEAKDNFSLDLESKLEDLRRRAKAVVEDLDAGEEVEGDEDEIREAQHKDSTAESRLSANYNADQESLIRLRNNFFADAKDFINEEDVNAISHRESSVKYRKYEEIPELIKKSEPQKIEGKLLQNNLQTSPISFRGATENEIVEKKPEKPEEAMRLIELQKENARLQAALSAMIDQAREKSAEQITKPLEEGLEREILLYKTSSGPSDRGMAMKRIVLAMVTRDCDPGLVSKQLDQCSKVNEAQFHEDLKSVLQTAKSVKGFKRTMFEGLLRYSVKKHSNTQGTNESLNAIINQLVVSQKVEETIDSLISILREEMPDICSQHGPSRSISPR